MSGPDIQAWARENVKRLKPYSSARDDFEGDASIFLDANENPFPTGYNRYPDPHQRTLKGRIARIKNVSPEQIFLGNGSDEAIDLLIRVFCEPKTDAVVIPQPTYGMYAVSAEVNNVNVIPARLTRSFDLDSASILKSVNAETKVIFLCSPNNPSGNLLSRPEIERLIEKFQGIVVIDEAYIDFTSSTSWTASLGRFKNLVVLQTLSKAWGLAGLRLGMCFAHPEIIELLNKIKPPYNINSFTQTEALRVIMAGEIQKNNFVDLIIKERETLVESLKRVRVVKKVHPSDANFLLTEVTDAKAAYSHLVKSRIVVRDRSNIILCENCLRITVGTPEENKQLIQALELL